MDCYRAKASTSRAKDDMGRQTTLPRRRQLKHRLRKIKAGHDWPVDALLVLQSEQWPPALGKVKDYWNAISRSDALPTQKKTYSKVTHLNQKSDYSEAKIITSIPCRSPLIEAKIKGKISRINSQTHNIAQNKEGSRGEGKGRGGAALSKKEAANINTGTNSQTKDNKTD